MNVYAAGRAESLYQRPGRLEGIATSYQFIRHCLSSPSGEYPLPETWDREYWNVHECLHDLLLTLTREEEIEIGDVAGWWRESTSRPDWEGIVVSVSPVIEVVGLCLDKNNKAIVVKMPIYHVFVPDAFYRWELIK